MGRIKVEGYLYTTDLDPADVDLHDKTGLSEDGYVKYSRSLGLDDTTFTLDNSVGEWDD